MMYDERNNCNKLVIKVSQVQNVLTQMYCYCCLML